MVKNLPSNAGDAGSILGQGTKILHAMGQLSLCAATRIQHSQTNKINLYIYIYIHIYIYMSLIVGGMKKVTSLCKNTLHAYRLSASIFTVSDITSKVMLFILKKKFIWLCQALVAA